MPSLLGITYVFNKALPNLVQNSLIPTMEKITHIGKKLQQEAERLGLKPAQVAEKFGVKPPSVYDWYEHGRIHKRHYSKLVELSDKPLTWWLEVPDQGVRASQNSPAYSSDDPRHDILLLLFDGLPKKEQEELIRTLTEKKQHYDTLIEELLLKRSAA